MVFFGVVEGGGRQDLGGDRAEASGEKTRLEGIACGEGLLVLGVVGGVDPGTVLCAGIVALAHALGGIVRLPKDPQQGLIRDRERIKDNEDDFIVSRHSRADLVVSGVGCDPCGVSDSGGVDALLRPELAFGSPKATHSKERLL